MSSLNDYRGYNVLDIADWFHSLPRFDQKLHQNSNSTFDPQNEGYIASLAVYFALPIGLMIFILILYLIMSICMCCCCTDGQKRKSIRIECKVFIFLFGLVCGLSFISGLYGDWQIYKGVKEVKNSSQDAVNWLKDIQHYSYRIKDALKVEQTITSLRGNIEQLKQSVPPGMAPFDQYIEFCNQILKYLKDTESQVTEANKTMNDANYDSVPEYVDQYGTMFCIIAVSVLIALAIIGLVFTFAICSRCILCCFTILAVISFILSSVLMGTTFGISVGGSDFCLNGKTFIRSEINNKDISDYLIDCISNNKVNSYLKDANQYVIEAKLTHHQLDNGLKGTLDKVCQTPSNCPNNIQSSVNNNLNNLNTKINETDTLLDDLSKTSDCKRINKDLNDILDSICTDILKGFVIIFFNTIAASLCFAILVFSATFALR